MKTITPAQQACLNKPKFQALVRARVDDGTTTFWDLSSLAGYDFISTVEIDETMDAPVSTARVVLEREAYFLSLSPLIAVSKLNNLGGSLHPLVQVGHAIKIETATIPLESTPASGDWILAFDGYIDQVDIGPDFKITVMCRDKGESLQDTVFKLDRGYCGVGSNSDSTSWTPSAPASAETVIQQIITDGNDWILPTLFTPVSPAWTVFGAFATANTPAGFKVTKGTNVLDAIQNIATQIGWDIRYRWDTGSSTYRLTFWSPTRSGAVSAYTFTKDQIFLWSKAIQDVTLVRNVIEVDFNDPAALDNTGSPAKIVPVLVSDAASIAKYHQRFMAITSAATANLDTAALATTLANAILSDLKEPQLDSTVELPFFFPAMLGDYYTFAADGIHFDADQSLGVYSIKHTFAKDKARTVLGVRGTPASSTNMWWSRAATWGIGPRSEDLPGQTPTPNAVASALGGVFIGQGANPTGGSIGQIPNPKIYAWDHTEFHVSTTTGFTPSASSLVGTGKQSVMHVPNLTVGTTYYVKLINVDNKGNKSAPSAQVSVTPRAGVVGEMLPSLQSAFDAYLNTAAVAPGLTGTIVPYDTDNWDNLSEFNVGTHKFAATFAGKYSFTAQVRIDGLTSSFSGASASLSLHINGGAAIANGIGVGPVDTIPHVATKSMMNPLITAELDLAAGNTVEVRLNYSVAGIFAGTSFTTGKADCKFMGSKVSTK